MTPNFSKEEFRSKDGSHFPYEVKQNLQVLAEQLEILRQHLQKPITINSGYRSPKHNQKVKGSKDSQHLLGKAADIVVGGVTPDEVADAIEFLIDTKMMKQGGLGRYNSFTHYDIRGKKSRWDKRPKKEEESQKDSE
jgi:uncharacterized protein YcbK (DUF882 family)